MVTGNPYWDRFAYTRPVTSQLSEAFGADFHIENTGGGCICILAELEGDYQVTIGSGVDGPLWDQEERDEYRATHGRFDGYGMTLEHGYGNQIAYARDLLAESPGDVVALVRRAIDMARVDEPAGKLHEWIRSADGTVEQNLAFW